MKLGYRWNPCMIRLRTRTRGRMILPIQPRSAAERLQAGYEGATMSMQVSPIDERM